MNETLRWHDNALELLDQRALPGTIRYVRYHSAADVAQAIREMVVRGAPAIGVTAAYGVALEALRMQHKSAIDFSTSLAEGFALLAQSRPTAVNLYWALERMQKLWLQNRTQNPTDLSARLLHLAHAIREEDVQINQRIGQHGAALLPDGARVLTHCNAGALATAGWGTALGVIRSAVAAGKRISVLVDETRPLLQGARLTAWEMTQANIPATLITDNMAGYLMAQGEVDAVIVGADRVAANGDVANKIGTYMVAVLAHRHRIPFYVALPLSTLDLGTPNGAAIPIEERAGTEVTGFCGVEWASPGVEVRNPAFDITPAELVTALITEQGVLPAPDSDNLAAWVASGGDAR